MPLADVQLQQLVDQRQQMPGLAETLPGDIARDALDGKPVYEIANNRRLAPDYVWEVLGNAARMAAGEGSDEVEIAVQLMGGPRAYGCPALDLTGRTSLPVLGALIEQMVILLTNDSGPAHIAYSVGISNVTVFGGTDPARWGPPAPSRVSSR